MSDRIEKIRRQEQENPQTEVTEETRDLSSQEPEEPETEETEIEEPEDEDSDPEDPQAGEPATEEAETETEEPAPSDQHEDREELSEEPDEEEPDEEEPEPEESEPEEETWETGLVGHTKKRKRKHRKKNWLLRLLIAAAVIAVFVVVGNLPYFQIVQTPVIGNKEVTDEDILSLAAIEPGSSIFFINPLGIKSRIKTNQYIESVRLDRQMPDTVEIFVTEREAVAQFIMKKKNGKKRYVVTDREGLVMGVYKKKKKVTLIEEVNAVEATEGSKIKVDEKGPYKKAMQLIATAKQGDLYFKKIDIRGSSVEAFIYDSLKCKGRYENLIDSINSGQLKAVVYRLYQQDVSKGIINIGDNNYCSFTP